MTVVATALLAGAAWTLGRLSLMACDWPELRRYERLGLEMTAGLGLTALCLSLLALVGLFFLSTPLLVLLSMVGIMVVMRVRGPRAWSQLRDDPPWVRRSTIALFACAAIACVGLITPVTDYDGLSYVVPIAARIAATGHLRVWTDQARSMWPLFHEVLLAYVLRLGGTRLMAVTALEWLAAIGVLSALARRACARSSHVPVAVAFAVAAPVVAFQISTAKEDLLLVAATAAVGFCLIRPHSSRDADGLAAQDLVAAGLFAGVAAGTKYSGLGVAIAAVVWVATTTRRQKMRASTAFALTTIAVGGLWYALNSWRFGNPVAPFVFGARGTPLGMASVNDLLSRWGREHDLRAFVSTPLRVFIQPDLYLGRAALFNPVVYVGLAGLGIASIRRRSAPLFLIASVLYVGWFFSLENVRLLLPAAVLLAPAAADVLVPWVSRWRPLARASGAALALPLLLLPVVGVMRAARYARDPAGFLYEYTERYADLQWINTHLDSRVHRVGSIFVDVGYLEIPFLSFGPTYQMELSFEELNDPALFLAACRRQRITHLLASPWAFSDTLTPFLRVAYDNPRAIRGGEHFFRPPGTEHVTLFEILP
jgi:hypothetical protein